VPEILGCSLKEILEKRYPKAKYKVIGIFEGEKLYEEFPGNMRSDLKPWLVDYETLMENL
jgi:FlaA1/EpsC-like NDP-sugar epimerase